MRRFLIVPALLLALPAASPRAVRAQIDLPDVSALRAEAERRLGATLEAVAGQSPPLPLGPSFPGASVLGGSIFSIPVGGAALPRPIHAEVLHDVVIALLPQWNVMQTFIGDPERWRVTHSESLVIVQPGERGAQTNLSVLLSTGDLLQFDLIEVTPYVGKPRTGRVYVGSEDWLLDRVFSLLPRGAGPAILDSGVSVPDLLADPSGVVYTFLYGRPGGLGSPRPPPPPAPAPRVAAPRPASPVPAVPAPAAAVPAPVVPEPLSEPAGESIDAGPPVPAGVAGGPSAPGPRSVDDPVAPPVFGSGPSADSMPLLPVQPRAPAPPTGAGAGPVPMPRDGAGSVSEPASSGRPAGVSPPVPPVSGGAAAGPVPPSAPVPSPPVRPGGGGSPARRVSPPSAGPPVPRPVPGSPAAPATVPGGTPDDELVPFDGRSPLFDDPVFRLPVPGQAPPSGAGSPGRSEPGGPGASLPPDGAAPGLLAAVVPVVHAASVPSSASSGDSASGSTVAVRVSLDGAIGSGPAARPAGQGFPVAQPSAPGSLFSADSLSSAPAPDLFVGAADLAALRARRDGLRRQIADARRSTGDQVADAALGIDRDLEYLRATYPGRIQMSFYWNPELPPLAPPFWSYGLWHDTDNTFIRLLAPDPVFRDEARGLEIEPVRMDSYLYRLPGIVENGSVTVPSGGGYVRAFWTRYDETEGRAVSVGSRRRVFARASLVD